MGQFEIHRLATNPPAPENGTMDANTLAKSIVDQAIGEKPIKKPNPRASIRGTARAEALAPTERKAIARKAAAARWKPEQ